MAVGLAIPVGSSLLLAAESLPTPAAVSDDMITVHLASGRTFTAALDARTNSTELWLRSDADGVEVLRPIRWDHVASAEVAGRTLSGATLHGLVDEIRRTIPAQPVRAAMKNDIVLAGSPDARRLQDNRNARASEQLAETPRVASLTIEAAVGRWDENVDPDGLVVHVYPLDASGAIVPVRGTLTADLKLERRNINFLHEPFRDAGYWSEVVHPSDFGPRGAVYKLRFQSVHPEFEDQVRAPGMVHACLAVPGQGTFEASTYISFTNCR
jgi:hypothetical protein